MQGTLSQEFEEVIEAVKAYDDLTEKIAELQSEKSSVEQRLKCNHLIKYKWAHCLTVNWRSVKLQVMNR